MSACLFVSLCDASLNCTAYCLLCSCGVCLPAVFVCFRFQQEQYSKTTMPQGNDHMIHPFSLTAQEKAIPLSLTDVALSKFHTRISLADHQLKNVLTLDVLKKKAAYDAQPSLNTTLILKKNTVSQSTKGGEKRRRRSQNNPVFVVDPIPDDSFQKKRVRVTERPGRTVDGLGGDSSVGQRVLLVALQPKLESVFKVFWDLELEPAVATPFFGLITRHNCDALGLPRFFDKIIESCSLANISVS